MGNDAIKYSNKAKSPKRRLLSAVVLCGAMAFVALPRTAAGTPPVEAPHGAHKGHAHGDGDGHKHGKTSAHGGHLDNWWSLSYGPGKAHKNPPLGWGIVNFLILLYLLYRFAGKPFKAYLQKRHDGVRNALDEAKQMREQAREKLAEIDEKLKGLNDEVKAIREHVKKDAEIERDRIVAAAETEAQRIVEAADRTMTEEIKRIRAQLEVEAVDAAISAAEKLLRKKVTEADRKRLDEQYLTQFTSGGSN